MFKIIDDQGKALTDSETVALLSALDYLSPHDDSAFQRAGVPTCGMTCESAGSVWRGADTGRIVIAARSSWTFDDRPIVEAYYLT